MNTLLTVLLHTVENMMLSKQVSVSMTNKECNLPTVANIISCVSYHLANIIRSQLKLIIVILKTIR